MKKSLNIKIPMSVLVKMDERGELNPEYLNRFICTYLKCSFEKDRLSELSTNYTFKVDNELHKDIKQQALDLDITMNDLVYSLLLEYY